MGPPGAAAVKRGWSDGACADMVLAGDLWLSVKARGAPPATAAGKLPPSSSRCNGEGTFPSLRGGKGVGQGEGQGRGQGEGQGRRGARECCVRCGFSCPPPRDVLLQYSEEALVHGVHYFTKQEISCAERLLWMAAVAVCAVFAVVFMHIAWVKFMAAPITTTVKTTFYPLYRLPFAAVTVCPATNVRRTVAEELLMQHLGERRPNETLQRQMWHVMAVFSKLQHPFFHTVDAHLEAAAPLVPRLQTLNISNFMLKVLPPCEDVFERCFWQGSEVSCCEEFRLQRYDGGLCYSFNSLTSDEKNGCDTQVYDSSAAAENESDGCLLRHNTACGTASGLEVYLRHFPQEDSLGDGQRLGQGHRVLVHQPDDFPEEGSSIFVPQQRLGLALAGTVKVSPSLTESSAEVRALQPAVRGCLFADERRLLVSRQYSLQSCLLECRLRHLAAQCGCLPYFFASLPLPNVSECTFAQIACLSKHSADLRFYRPPERMRGVEGRLRERIWQRLVDRGIDCSHCLPTCHDSTYDLEADVTTDNKLTSSNTTYLDIFYKDLYAVKYGRELSFGETELLVSFGGIASLFLGVSVLSGFELLYYLCKLCAALACGGRGRVAPRRTPMRVAARAAAAAKLWGSDAPAQPAPAAAHTPAPAAVHTPAPAAEGRCAESR